jgi:hypothetical protein
MGEDLLLMNNKERQRKAILEAVKNKHFTLPEAAERMHISLRQTRRLLRCYEEEGDKALVHGHRGKPSNHRGNMELKTLVIALYQAKYRGFGPTLAAEKLTEEGHAILAETLRLWLKAAGLWEERRKRKAYRQQRKRREQFGELLQLDGSFHHWFGKECPTACLMNLVDDATGTTMALLAEEETTEAAMILLQQWIKRYGVPKSIYVDLKTVYVSPKTLSSHNEGPNGLPAAFTHFSKACDKLGIKIIKAYSPQAKGRVERKHAVFQDRFVKELQLKNIKNIEEANALLENYFLVHINKKFAKPPMNACNAHRKAKIFGDLKQIFCWEQTRQVQNDWTISFENKCYQIQKNTSVKIKAKQRIIVRQHLDDTLSLWYEGHSLTFEQIEYVPKLIPQRKGRDLIAISKMATANKHKSPWAQFNTTWLANKKKVANQQPGAL